MEQYILFDMESRAEESPLKKIIGVYNALEEKCGSERRLLAEMCQSLCDAEQRGMEWVPFYASRLLSKYDGNSKIDISAYFPPQAIEWYRSMKSFATVKKKEKQLELNLG